MGSFLLINFHLYTDSSQISTSCLDLSYEHEIFKSTAYLIICTWMWQHIWTITLSKLYSWFILNPHIVCFMSICSICVFSSKWCYHPLNFKCQNLNSFILIHYINTHRNSANLTIDISINSTLIESPILSHRFLRNTLLLTGVSVPCQSITYIHLFQNVSLMFYLKWFPLFIDKG